MGLGIIALMKTVAPLSIYLCGIAFFFLALAGKVRWTLLLVVFLLPLRNVIERLQDYPLGNQYIDILIIAMLIGWVVSAMGNTIKFMSKSSLNLISIVLVLYTFVSLISGSVYLGHNIFDISDTRVQDWKNFSLLPVLFFLTLNNVTDKKWVWRCFVVMCLAMVLMGYYTTSQISWFSSLVSRNKIHGTFQFLGPNEVAAFLNQYTIILLSVYFFIKKKLHKILLLLLILVNLYCVLFIYSRAAYAALALGLFLVFAIKNPKWLIPLFLAGIFWQVVLPEKAIERIEETTNVYGQLDASSERRIVVWQEGMRLFESSPIMGIGFGVFRFMGYDLGDTHNIYVKILVEQGLIGLFIFLITIFCFMKEGFTLYRHGDDDFSRGLGLGLGICMFVLMINNFFGDRWTYLEVSSNLWVYAGLVARLNIISSESKSGNNKTENQPRKKKSKLGNA